MFAPRGACPITSVTVVTKVTTIIRVTAVASSVGVTASTIRQARGGTYTLSLGYLGYPGNRGNRHTHEALERRLSVSNHLIGEVETTLRLRQSIDTSADALDLLVAVKFREQVLYVVILAVDGSRDFSDAHGSPRSRQRRDNLISLR